MYPYLLYVSLSVKKECPLSCHCFQAPSLFVSNYFELTSFFPIFLIASVGDLNPVNSSWVLDSPFAFIFRLHLRDLLGCTDGYMYLAWTLFLWRGGWVGGNFDGHWVLGFTFLGLLFLSARSLAFLKFLWCSSLHLLLTTIIPTWKVNDAWEWILSPDGDLRMERQWTQASFNFHFCYCVWCWCC